MANLFDYMQTALKFMGVDELWVSHGQYENVPQLHDSWRKRGYSTIDGYTK